MASQGKYRLSKPKPTITDYVFKSKKKACLTKRLLKGMGKAAWIAGTTFLILVMPLVIEMDREQQINELESQSSLAPSPL